MKRIVTSTAMLAVIGVLALWARPARADIVAAYLEGHGGVSSAGPDASARASTSASSNSGVSPGLGFQVGARLLFLEGYFDRTAFGSGAAVSRGILGIRAGVGAGGLRLVLRGGGGIIEEEGGALTGLHLGVPDRRGVVGRAGVALEKRLTPNTLLAGLAVDGEAFSLQNPGGSTTSPAPIVDRTQGADVFVSLSLKFELGI